MHWKTLALIAFASVAFASAQDVDDLLAKGDERDRKFEAQKALEYYLPAEKADPYDPRILTRVARQYRHLMSDASDKEEKLRLGGIALTYAKRAATVAPDDSEAHLSVAISYGKLLPLQGAREQSTGSKRIKESVDLALKLDPSNDTAWNVLGRWHRVLADVGTVKRMFAPLVAGNLPKGSNEEAVRCFQKAIALNPRRPMHHIELGRTYAQMDRKEEARRSLQKGLALPNTDKDDPENKANGRETLQKL